MMRSSVRMMRSCVHVAQVLWQLNFSRAQRPYLAMLAVDADDPTKPPPRPPGWCPEDDEEEEEEGDGDGGRGVRGARGNARADADDAEAVHVDADGIGRRLIAVGVRPGRLGALEVLEDDVLVYTRMRAADDDDADPRAGCGGARDAEIGALMRCDLGRACKESRLVDDVVDFTVSADLGATCVLCEEAGELKLRVFESGVRPGRQDDDDEEEVDMEVAGPESGLVDVEGRVLLQASGHQRVSRPHVISVSLACHLHVISTSSARHQHVIRASSARLERRDTWRRHRWTRVPSGVRCSMRRGRRRCATHTLTCSRM